MRPIRINSILLVLAVLLLFQQYAAAQYDIPKSVLGSGGDTTENGSYIIVGTVGQPAIGISSGASNAVFGGFWFTIDPGSVEIPPVDYETIVVEAFSPVDIEVTDPAGQMIDKDTSTIPGATYTKMDLNGDSDPDVQVTIPDALLGDYSILVIPEAGASSSDTYTLDISYADESHRLAENVQVGDIPDDPYVHFYPYLRLEAQWMLVSLPKQPEDTSITTVLSDIEGKYESVWRYDPALGWRWYVPAAPGASNLSDMESRIGYWIMANEQCFLKIEGGDPDTSIPIILGWNLVGYCDRIYREILDCMSSIDGMYVSVWEYSPSLGWRWYVPAAPGASNLWNMSPGKGYWIDGLTGCTWDIGSDGGASLAPPAIPVAMRDRVPTARPEVPYIIWGNLEVNGVKVTGAERNAPVVLLKVGDRVVSSYRFGSASKRGNSYAIDVPPEVGSSAQAELYVEVDGREVKADLAPPGRPGQLVRLDLSIQHAPGVSQLHQNYPNPFNPETWIPYQLREDAHVEVSIYTSSGQLVRTLSLGRKPAGFYTDRTKAAYWDGRNEAGEQVSSGVYFYSIKAGDLRTTRKMVVAR